MEGTLDRNALIAYMYDVYSVEQAVAQIDNDLWILNKKQESITAQLDRELRTLQDTEKRRVSQLHNSYNPKNTIKEISWRDAASFPKCLAFSVATILLSFFVGSLISYGHQIAASISLLFCIICGSMAGISYLDEKSSLVKKWKNELEANNNKQYEMIQTAIAQVYQEMQTSITKTKETANKQLDELRTLTEQQQRLKADFEELRYELYQSLQLIPYPHQNVFSACYIYRYLVTTRTIDLNYIFTQLNMEKILHELKIITPTLKDILLVQRQILAENRNQTSLLKAIHSNLSAFYTDFSDGMTAIRDNLSEMTDNQRALLNNQATMYREYLETAQQNARSQAELTDYTRMIEQNTRVNAMFQRAEFLSLKFDRNYSGNY